MFQKGQSGNPGGKRKRLALSRAVRASEGLKTWARLLDVRDGKVLEPYFNKETKTTEWLAPGAKTTVEACRLLLAYCWGTPVAVGNEELERRVAQLESILKDKQPSWVSH